MVPRGEPTGDEATPKGIAGPGGVDDWHLESWSVELLSLDKAEAPLIAQGRADQCGSKTVSQFLESGAKTRRTRVCLRKGARGDDYVDLREQVLDPWADLFGIHHCWDPGAASQSCCACCRDSLVTVDQQDPARGEQICI